MFYITNDKKEYKTLDSAKAALIRAIDANRESALLMGRANTWEVPNWNIYDKPEYGIDEQVMTGCEVWSCR